MSQLSDVDFMLHSKAEGLFREPLPSHLETFSFNPKRAFSDYLEHAYLQLTQTNPRAHLPCPLSTATYQQLVAQGDRNNNPHIVDLIAPFELRQNNNHKAVLLIHGLTDSPFTFHDLAQVYFQQGYSVRTIVLPGHGSAAGALKHISADDLQQATDYAITRTLADYEQVLLGGYSMGAALLIDHLTKQPVSNKITGLMLFSPASEPHNKHGWLAKWLDFIPFVDWIDKDTDLDFAKYESFPLQAAAVSHELMSRISIKQLAQRVLPNLAIFATFSDIDTTIDNQATFTLLNALHAPRTRPNNSLSRIFYFAEQATPPHILSRDYSVVTAQCNNSLCANIKGMSHIAIVNKPSNPYYGAQGIYRNCGSYLDDDTLFKACKTTADIVIGERTAANLTRYQPFARLTFNPYFEQLKEQIIIFTDSLATAPVTTNE
ncbi:alpha/beta hydrolase [Pseudoalteromonas mariniglutinosa]|uniref:alpha/beta hydrolase n=1 Tax=Pseudoalteromonas mariniglutinosa TaxID=206042 RepID=UPI00384EA7D8